MIAVLVAAGSSRRMGFDKLMADVAGKPVLAHALLAFEHCPEVERIVLVGREDRLGEFRAVIEENGIRKVSAVVPGGSERHFSVWNGLEAAALEPGDFVAVHDAARPLITPGEITRCLELARETGAAVCAAPIADTLKRATPEGRVAEGVDRENLWAMQTPQIFLAGLLKRAYNEVLRAGALVTDEVSALQFLGEPVALYSHYEPNFKITFPRDIELASLVLSARGEGRGHKPASMNLPA